MNDSNNGARSISVAKKLEIFNKGNETRNIKGTAEVYEVQTEHVRLASSSATHNRKAF